MVNHYHHSVILTFSLHSPEMKVFVFEALHFLMNNIYQSCDLGCAIGADQRQHQPVMLFVYWRLHDVHHVSP